MPAASLPGRPSHAGLALLLEAFDAAREAACDDWQFAIELWALRDAEFPVTELRRLMIAGHVRHGIDRCPRSDKARRSVRPVAWLTLRPDSCFILSTAGAELARSLFRRPASSSGATAKKRAVGRKVKPRWVEARREFYVGDELVKRFRGGASDQETLLRAFEEGRWGPWIDDPLSPRPGVDAKERLHQVVKRLKRNQRVKRVHFSVSAKGERVYWTLIE
jgi:hypothetical protein